MGKIKCGVRNCLYNEKGICEASAIEVKPESANSALNSLNTYCETFIQAEDAADLGLS